MVLLDPLDVHWTALLPLQGDGPDGLRRQYDVAKKWAGLQIERINARVWVPAGYKWGVDHPAFRCPACGRAAASGGSCPLDGTRLEETDAGLDLAVHQTLAHGGAVWPIRHQQDLSPVEGIGALLRY